MSKSLETKNIVVAGALIGAGAVVAAIGTTDLTDEYLPLAVIGSALVAVGMTFVLAVTVLSTTQRIAVGATLTAAGAAVAVAATRIGAEATIVVVALVGGAMLTAGVLQILKGATDHRAEAAEMA